MENINANPNCMNCTAEACRLHTPCTPCIFVTSGFLVELMESVDVLCLEHHNQLILICVWCLIHEQRGSGFSALVGATRLEASKLCNVAASYDKVKKGQFTRTWINAGGCNGVRWINLHNVKICSVALASVSVNVTGYHITVSFHRLTDALSLKEIEMKILM